MLGDVHTSRNVLRSLLDNAVKFRRSGEAARVHVGVVENPNEFVVFVRDAGVSFNVRSKAKLFRLFSRLHGEAFEGLRVSLAVVRVLVKRLGGRVCADGKVGQGAKFFVALPKPPSREN